MEAETHDVLCIARHDGRWVETHTCHAPSAVTGRSSDDEHRSCWSETSKFGPLLGGNGARSSGQMSLPYSDWILGNEGVHDSHAPALGGQA